MIIKKNLLYVFGIALIVLVGALLLFSDSGRAVTQENVIQNGEAQVVKLSVQNGNYVFEPSSVKKGIPVRLEADVANMPGCSKGIVSAELSIKKTFSSNDNTLEFTPDKAGTFNFACSMNMYKGTLTILESDGSKSNYVEQKTATSGGSCGAGGGGCGCGGMMK